MRNPAIALGGATLACLLLIGLVTFSQLSQLRQDVSQLASSLETATTPDTVLDELRALDARIDQINGQLDDMTARFDRLDASIAGLPTAPADDTRIGTILSELQALRTALGGLSLDLGIVCDVLGC